MKAYLIPDIPDKIRSEDVALHGQSGWFAAQLPDRGIFPDIVTRPFRPRIELGTEIYRSAIRPLSEEAQVLAGYLEEVALSLPGSPSSGKPRARASAAAACWAPVA